MDLLKYDMTDIWAVAGDVVAPDSAKVRAGWGVEVVPRQWWNWFENRQDNNIAYMLQKGFPEWDATTEYIINKSYVQRNGTVYRATATSTNSDPTTLTSWVKAFPNSTAASEALAGVTPAANTMPYFTSGTVASTTSLTAFGRSIAALVDAAAARTLFSAQLADSNLTALSGVTANVNVLPYFTSTTAMTGTTLTAFARTLLDDGDAATMRATLGLGTAATQTITTSTTDNTVGRITKVGDFGESGGDPIQFGNTVDANTIVVSGTYVFPNSGINLPAASGFYLKHTSYPQVGYAKQIANHITLQSQYIRTQVAGVWSAWTEVWTTTNLVKTTSTADSTVGNMLKVADFGIGTQGVRVTNLDGLPATGTGWYTLGSPYTGSPLASTPVSVMHTGYDNERTQMAFYEGSTTVRVFVRKYRGAPTNAWGPWQELYHTGNSQALVDQVTAAVQPTLDLKANLAGATFSGQVAAPSFYAIGTASNAGIIYLKALNSIGAGGVDAQISVDSSTAASAGGRMVVTANLTYLQSALTVTGNASFQGSVAASGQVSGSSFSTAGNINCLNITASNSMLIQGAGTALTVNNAASFAGTVCRANTNGFSVLPTGLTASNASVYSFYGADGTTLRGAVYGTSANQVVIQTGINQSAIICDSAGNTSMKTVAVNALSATGRVSSSQDLLSATHLYMNNGNSYVDSGGNVYGSTWGGLLSSFLANTYIQGALLGNNLAAMNVQGIGVYAFLQNATGVNMGIGATAAGGLIYSSHNNVSGAVAPGTWRCMGWANTAGVSVYQRIA